MSYPQGFLFQPSVSLALHSCPSFGSGSVVLGARAEELALGRSSSGSAFAPYAGSASFGSSSSPGFNSHLPYGGEPRAAATLNSFVGPGYDPSGITGPLDFHPFGGALQGGYPYGDPAYRKNATRDATATLKAWLNEHRKNPYPTKGEKIMLAIITKMTLTQVSTWFANARRRLKKENKMTWTPRNRSEDEEEDDNIDLERNDDDEEPPMMKPRGLESKMEAGSAGNRCELYKDDSSSSSSSSSSGNDTDRAFTEPDFLKERAGRRAPQRPGESSPRAGDARLGAHGAPASERSPSPEPKRCGGDSGPGPGASGNGAAAPVSPTSNPAPKPKLWSLAEIATSSDKSRGAADPAQGLGTHQRSPFPHSASLSRLYYGAPFIPGYSNYGTLGHLHNPGSTLGLHQTMLQRAEAMAMARDCKLRSHCTQLDLCKDLTHHELKKSMANV